MRIGILNESSQHEKRCAVSADSVKKLVQLGADIKIEKGAGLASGIEDAQFKQAGASIANSAKTATDKADIVLTIGELTSEQAQYLPDKCLLAGMLNPYGNSAFKDVLKEKQIISFAMELLPRISRAQAMDVLSSQSNLSGYRAVIDAVAALGKATPMMMTAAGTVPPAKVLVLGAGVAGLQAIATAKRLGAVVSAFDVRPAVKEQVESLGAKFIEVENDGSGEAEGGYASEMSEEYQKRQANLIHETLKTQDICITTALIPGKPAPELITSDMLQSMKAGSVIVDLAAVNGGNCKASRLDETVEQHGVRILAFSNMPSRIAHDATPLYARNLYQFLTDLLVDKEAQSIKVKWDDELVTGTCMTKDGNIIHPRVREWLGEPEPAEAKAEPDNNTSNEPTQGEAHNEDKAEEKAS